MMIYIIYKNKKFVGYTYDKEILNKFKKSRKSKSYSFKKMKESNIPKEIVDSYEFINHSLEYYTGYRISTELPLFLYEFEDLYENLTNDILSVTESLYSILELIKYLKLNKDDQKIIKMSINYIIELIETLTCTHEPIYDEFIDLVKYINYKERTNNYEK